MRITTVRVSDLYQAEAEVNNEIKRLERNGYEVINVQYMDRDTWHYIMIIYK